MVFSNAPKRPDACCSSGLNVQQRIPIVPADMSDCIVSQGVALGISDPGFERGKKFVCVHHSPSSLELIGCHATFESVCLTRLRAPYQLKNRRIASQTAEKNPSTFFVVRASFS